jgi:hypothetical protein
MEGSGSGSIQINYGSGNPCPGGPKTHGSYGSGTGTLVVRLPNALYESLNVVLHCSTSSVYV